MRDLKARFLILLLIVGAGVWWLSKDKEETRMENIATVVTKKSVPAGVETIKLKTMLAKQADYNHTESLKKMNLVLKKFARRENTLKALFDHLQSEQKDPMVSHDSNEDTGEMAIIRTKTLWPGTRYFHAQYFGDGDGTGFLQHMSFEYKPGSSSMTDVISSLNDTFKLSAPLVTRDDYVKWELDDGYILWVMRMGSSDLKDDPFNAYSSADVGTIRVAIESDIHGE